MKSSTIKVEYRDIAKLLCRELPLESDEYHDAVEVKLSQLKSLPAQVKLSMRIAYIFSAKVPHDEREDCFQSFTATLIQSQVTDEKLAYSIIFMAPGPGVFV
ncbi:MAG: hypothetical protein PHU23_00050 [Dehalococcoidales bacterium]|nr:hypothetical protein [Dehalococcoidales bacterium]